VPGSEADPALFSENNRNKETKMAQEQYFMEIKDICKSFSGIKVLSNVNLTLKKGEIHAVIGENGAGKSTLMKIILGMHHAESGSIFMNGEPCHFKTPEDALNHGIAMIHQEISLVPEFSVAENVWLGREKLFSKASFINAKERVKKTQELIDKYNLKLDAKAIVKNLRVAQMQLVELVRAVSYDAELIIMDEPTSALSGVEIMALFDVMRDLASRGKTIIFISHKLEELFEICDRVTVLCDGRTVYTSNTEDTSIDEIIKAMVGRDISGEVVKTEPQIGDVIFKCEHLSGQKFHDINLEVRKGEIVGLCGLIGAGRTEILNGIFGIDRIESGSLTINGQTFTHMTIKKAIKAGIAMINEDRLHYGTIHKQSVKANLSAVKLWDFCAGIWIKDKEEKAACDKYKDLMSVKMASYDQLIESLSGGNQQKVIIARWLMMDPKLMILDEPTRGIDVGAKTEVHKLIDQLAHQGRGILMASSELHELLALCDRILVVRDGRIVAEVPRAEATQDGLMKHAFNA